MGFWNSVAAPTRTSLLDRLCGELGWPIDVRKGNVIGLYFSGDRITERRTVIVGFEESSRIMTFSCRSRAQFTERNLPDSLPSVMLARNQEVTLGAWVADIEDGELALVLQYTALTAAMDAANFKVVCTLMIKEVAEIEAKLHGKGML